MEEIKFEKGELPGGIEFEWAKRSVDTRTDLILHFFLKEKKPNPTFFEYLKKAAHAHIPQACGVETAYSEDFDGHDMVVFSVQAFTAIALKNSIVKFIESSLMEEHAK